MMQIDNFQDHLRSTNRRAKCILR